jgi:hypothetical protein
MAASGPGRGGLFFAVQLAAGAPFLVATPMEYLRASFDFGRVFTHKIVVGEWQAGPLDRHWRPPLALYRLPPACHCRLPATAACRPLPHAGHCRMLLPTAALRLTSLLLCGRVVPGMTFGAHCQCSSPPQVNFKWVPCTPIEGVDWHCSAATSSGWRQRGVYTSSSTCGTTSACRSVRARPGRLSTLSVFHSKPFLYGAFVWAHTAFNTLKWRFPARAVLWMTRLPLLAKLVKMNCSL